MSEPLTGARFEVTIDGIEPCGVREVALPAARLGTGSPPKVELGTLVLRRGLGAASDWYLWWDEGRRSRRKKPRGVTVSLRDRGGTKQVQWRYVGAVPVGYAVSALDASTGDALIETLEVSVAGFEASFADA